MEGDGMDMTSQLQAQPSADGRAVVHLVGRLNDAVFSFLGPATTALAEAGIDQCVVLIDDPRAAHLKPRFHGNVELVAAPYEQKALRRWSGLSAAFRGVVSRRPLRAIHLHGLMPLLLGRGIARSFGAGAVPVYFSPHASPSLRPRGAFGALIGPLVKGILATKRQRTIVNMLEEAYTLHRVTREPIHVVEGAVPPVFFDTRRHEARRPLIVTGSRDDEPRSVELIAQLAVLLSGDDLQVAFNWIGRLGSASVARLKAANVGYFEASDDAEIALRLACGWLYLAPRSGPPGFPVFVAAAMALGLPCAVIGSPEHSDLIRDGETGFLCRTDNEVMRCIGRLIDEPLLRKQIGQAARREAENRFSPGRFRDSLFSAYELDVQTGY
jgi:glycosyltransferase involved in cell wall biosynthesis